MRLHFERLWIGVVALIAATFGASGVAQACQAGASEFAVAEARIDPFKSTPQSVEARLVVRVTAPLGVTCRLTARFVQENGLQITAPLKLGAIVVTPSVAGGSAQANPNASGLAWVEGAGPDLTLTWRLNLTTGGDGSPPKPQVETGTVYVEWSLEPATGAVTASDVFSANSVGAGASSVGSGTASATLKAVVPAVSSFTLSADCNNVVPTQAQFIGMQPGLETCVAINVQGNVDANLAISSVNRGRIQHGQNAEYFATYRATAQFPDLTSALVFDGDAGTSGADLVFRSGSRNRLVLTLLDTTKAKAAGVYRDTITVTLSAP